MAEPVTGFRLSDRFTHAVDYARELHTEFRKGTRVPYMAHLLGVAALVMGEADGRIPVTEDMVIAALLHDTVEDHGGLPRLKDVDAQFGTEVARMVAALSDTFAADHDKKEVWEERKKAYIDRLKYEDSDVQLISIADKLYNARAILDDYRVAGMEVFKRFKRGAGQQLWYFDELVEAFESRMSEERIFKEFCRVVRELSGETGISCPSCGRISATDRAHEAQMKRPAAKAMKDPA
jgi:(p)ppGpp synthase/HD superfamily hydrolase